MRERIKRYFVEDLSFFLLVPALLWELLFFCIPLTCLFIVSIVHNGDMSLFSGVTLTHYTHVFQAVYAKIVLRSLLLALCVSLCSLCIGYPVAYYLACKASRAMRTVLLFFL